VTFLCEITARLPAPVRPRVTWRELVRRETLAPRLPVRWLTAVLARPAPAPEN
jgi:hypothetical protein